MVLTKMGQLTLETIPRSLGPLLALATLLNLLLLPALQRPPQPLAALPPLLQQGLLQQLPAALERALLLQHHLQAQVLVKQLVREAAGRLPVFPEYMDLPSGICPSKMLIVMVVDTRACMVHACITPEAGVPGLRRLDPGVAAARERERERSDRNAELIGQRLLQGWALLDAACPR